MGELETLGIAEEIQTLVSDKLQVVSYKWLSRNFLLPSNASKRLLQEFVEKYGNGLEVVYSLSGWLKNNPSAYHVTLVSGPKLEEAKKVFDGNCSVQVYSVQPSIPKDPATLWNAEFVQAEELFRQPPTVDNCLRDNRFCGISNSFVKRHPEGAASSISPQQPKFVEKPPSKSKSAAPKVTIPLPEQKKVQQPSPKVDVESSKVVKDVKTESTSNVEGHSSDKGKVPQIPMNKKKGQNEKSTSANGSSLANMWDRASAKSKANIVDAEANSTSNLNSNEAQTSAREAVEGSNSDNEGQHVNVKRTSNGEGSRKRRVVFDFSDEEDECKDAVNLASPDPPKLKAFVDETKHKAPLPEKNLDIDIQKVVKPVVKEEKAFNKELNELSRENSSVAGESKTVKSPSSDKLEAPEINRNENIKVTDAGSTSPKRRKVLKTRIDERGREVTEVVWEGDEKEKKTDSDVVKKSEETDKNIVNRPSVPKKSPAVVPSNPSSKTENKKGGKAKDPKQGNIMSFFKKV